MKLWIVTAVDHGETYDGKARVLGGFANYDEAKNCVDEDIREWIDNHAEEDITSNCVNMYAWLIGGNDGCEWNIEEIEV